MKKLAITLAIILGLGLCSFAQGNRYYSSEEVYYEGEGGLFGKGMKLFSRGENDPLLLGLPENHGLDDDSDGAPLGSGVAVLLSLGGAYLVAKKRKDE